MRKWLLTLALLAVCLPPGVPALDTMHMVDYRMIEIKNITAGVPPVRALVALYRASDGREYGLTRLLGSGSGLAIVDDKPMDPDATDWWLDPGLVTDDVPAKAQADPKSTCQWRRRGYKV